MADLTALTASVNKLSADAAAAVTAIQTLRAQVTSLEAEIAADATEQAALDALTTQLTATDTGLVGATPAPAPTP